MQTPYKHTNRLHNRHWKNQFHGTWAHLCEWLIHNPPNPLVWHTDPECDDCLEREPRFSDEHFDDLRPPQSR